MEMTFISPTNAGRTSTSATPEIAGFELSENIVIVQRVNVRRTFEIRKIKTFSNDFINDEIDCDLKVRRPSLCHPGELLQNIYFRIDSVTDVPLRLTLTTYSKLIKPKTIPLTLGSEISANKQQLLLSVLQRYPVNLFLSVQKSVNGSNPSSSFPNKPLQKLVAV